MPGLLDLWAFEIGLGLVLGLGLGLGLGLRLEGEWELSEGWGVCDGLWGQRRQRA